MNFLFWLLFVVNLLLIGFMIWGIGFRASFGATTDWNSIALIVLILLQAGSLFVRYGEKKPHWSLCMVALPVMVLFIVYLLDDKTRVGE